jgi:hypothetical protein
MTYPIKQEGQQFWYRDRLVIVDNTSLKRGVISLYHDSLLRYLFIFPFLTSILLLDHLTSHVTYRSGAAFTYDDSEAFRPLP